MPFDSTVEITFKKFEKTKKIFASAVSQTPRRQFLTTLSSNISANSKRISKIFKICNLGTELFRFVKKMGGLGRRDTGALKR